MPAKKRVDWLLWTVYAALAAFIVLQIVLLVDYLL